MASSTIKLSYQRLKHEPDHEHEHEHHNYHHSIVVSDRSIRRSRFGKFNVRRRPRIKIPSLKRFLRRKVKVVRFAWRKVCKRLKESQSHFGDIFGGNYLFMQVTPTPLQCARNGNGNYKLSSSVNKGLYSV